MPKTKSSCGTRTVTSISIATGSARAEGHQLVAAVVDERHARQHDFAGSPALLFVRIIARCRRFCYGSFAARRHASPLTALQIRVDHAHRIADRLRLAVIEPERAVAEVAHLVELVRDEDQRHAAVLHLLNLGHALRGELLVADREHFVDQQHVGIDVDRDREAEPHVHAGGVGLDRLIDELADAGELDDLVEARVDLACARGRA